ncbi:nephrocystin-4 [Parasteatoda tepidariorum]|uniref:nephrocystin-4 n=1 Tax=Parasteatoda tepidariorum TaxID=114398 RepID=UPI001C7264C8|nr:nephrocystin-4 [Parasteatoda tepidariorum]
METETQQNKLSLVKYIPLSKERNLETLNNPQTFCVCLKHVEGFHESANTDSYRIQTVLFDQKYERFLGSFWSGKPVMTKNSLCFLNQNFYFYTSVPAKELLLVIEIISESKDNQCKTCGWLYLLLDEIEDEVTYKLPFIKGSSSFLLLDVIETERKDINFADHTTGLEISFSLSPQHNLLEISHLLPENVLIDPTTKIPGVLSQIEATDDDEYAYQPHLQKCITFVLERLCVRMQSPLSLFEDEILQKVQAHLSAVKPDETLLRTRLIQRRLQVAVHNGFHFIQEPDFYNLLIPTATSNKTLRRASSLGSVNVSGEERLVLRSDVKLPNIPDDPNINIVFLLEYIVALENSQEVQMSATSVTKNPICHMIIAWGFCSLKILLKNPFQSIDLSCDPTFAPHKIKFLRTEKDLKLSFSASSLLKQKKNSSLSSPPSEPHEHVYSSPSKSDSSVVSSNVPFLKHVSKYKSVADIPMSVEHSNGKNFEKVNSVYKNDNNLSLQEVVLVPSSLPLIPPLLLSFPLRNGVPSGTFIKLYWDKLPSILDHHGKPAFFIDNPMKYKIDADIELHCQPQKNECMLNFIAISCLDEYVEIPCEVFFTFQFYRFLPIKTESLVLKQLSDNEDLGQKQSFVFTLHGKQDKGDQMPGFNVTYNLDPTELNPGEYKSFINYLIHHSLHVDLWNAQSLLYFGTVMLPLKFLCRQGKEAVSTVLELDIVNCEFLDESLAQNSTSIRKSLGKLHVNLASKRHPLSSKALENYEDKNLYLDSAIVYSNGKGPSESPRHVISKARPIAETDKELSKLLTSRHMVNNLENMSPDPHVTEERRRKLARMENIRKLEKGDSSDGSTNSEFHGIHLLKEKQRNLLSIESYIQKNKTEIIHSLLCKSVTSEKLIFPVIGSKVFFEFVIQNPFPVAKKIEIVWKCPELSLVVENKLWHILRSMNNLSQNTTVLNFVDTESSKSSIVLQPGEKVHIPFTYQCFTAPPTQLDLFKAVSGHHFTSDVLSSTPAHNIVQSSVKIRFMTEERTLLAVLNLKVQPLPPSFTHVFKFLSIENSMFKKSIQISRDNSMNEIDLQISDSSVVCTIQKNESSEMNVKILVKAPTKSSGKCSEFYVFVYSDEFQIVPYQTWRVSLCAFQRIDLSCVAGQLMRSSLLIRGTHATNLVRCFSSSQDLLLDPNEAFILSPFAVQELSMNMRSLIPGIKHFQITMVDQSQEQVVQTWLLVLSCQKPSVSKAFQIHLSVGKETAKRITYSNPYHQTRSFFLYSSHPHMLNLRESEFSVPPGKSYSIGLYFMPQDYIFTETIFLYMNDTSDKNEETYCIKVVCQ